MTIIDKSRDRRKRSGNRPATDLYPANYALTKTEYEDRHRNDHLRPEPGRGTAGPPPSKDDAPAVTLEQLVRRAPGLTGVVHTLQREGFDDRTIVRLLLVPDRHHGPRGALKRAVLDHLESVGGSVSSTDGRCVDALARVLSTTSVAMQDTLHVLATEGKVIRTVSNAGTFRVSIA